MSGDPRTFAKSTESPYGNIISIMCTVLFGSVLFGFRPVPRRYKILLDPCDWLGAWELPCDAYATPKRGD
jgi:hypothetical protein